MDPSFKDSYLHIIMAWGNRLLESACLQSSVNATLSTWQLGVLPSDSCPEEMILKFAECFLTGLCDAVTDDVVEFDLDDVATDGNRKIAKIVVNGNRHPYR
eukprot:6592512-Karenia_brevis.AAC.1